MGLSDYKEEIFMDKEGFWIIYKKSGNVHINF